MHKIALLVLLASLVGCTSTGNPSGPGLIHSNVKMPLGIGDSTVAPVRTGVACSKSLFTLFAWGDGSIEAAARDGGITKIRTVNIENYSFLVYGRACTIVKGE